MLAPPVVIVLFTPSTTAEPAVTLPTVPSTVTLLAPVPVVIVSLVITVLLPALSLTVTVLAVASVVFVPSVIVLEVALDVFTLPLPSSITLLSTVVLLDFAPSTNVFSSTVDVLVLAPSLIT